MPGGKIRNGARAITTAIALAISKGKPVFGLALGMFLLAVALLVNPGLNLPQQRQKSMTGDLPHALFLPGQTTDP